MTKTIVSERQLVDREPCQNCAGKGEVWGIKRMGVDVLLECSACHGLGYLDEVLKREIKFGLETRENGKT